MRFILVLSILFTLLLFACSGGGGDDGDVTPDTTGTTDVVSLPDDADPEGDIPAGDSLEEEEVAQVPECECNKAAYCEAWCACDPECCSSDDECGVNTACAGGVCVCEFMQCEGFCCGADEACVEGECQHAPVPYITVDFPTRGGFVMAEPGPLVVTGKVEVADDLAHFTMNGEPVPLFPDGTFGLQITPDPGMVTMVFESQTEFGMTDMLVRSFIYGDLVNCGEVLENGLEYHIGQDGLDDGTLEPNDLSGMIAAAIDAEELGGMIATTFQLYLEEKDVLVAIDLSQVSTDKPSEVHLTPEVGYAFATVKWLNAGFNYAAEVPPVVSYGTITFDQLLATAKVQLHVGEGGKMAATAAEATIEGTNFQLQDDGLLPSGIKDALVPKLEGALLQAAKQGVVDAMEMSGPDFLNSMNLSDLVTIKGAPVESVAVEYVYQDVVMDKSGVYGHMGTSVPCLAEVEGEYGVPVTPGGAPELAEYEGFALAMTDDVVNQILVQAWSLGVIDLLALFQPDLAALGIDTGAAPFNNIEHLKLKAHLPPQVDFGQVKGDPPRMLDPPTIRTADLEVIITTEDGEKASFLVSGKVPMGIVVDPVWGADFDLALLSDGIDLKVYPDLEFSAALTPAYQSLVELLSLKIVSSGLEQIGTFPTPTIELGATEALQGTDYENTEVGLSDPLVDFLETLPGYVLMHGDLASHEMTQ